MSIREADGKILAHCHAGCPQYALIDALKDRGLWEPSGPRELSFEERFECAYDYRDEHRELLYQGIRLHSPKDFRQRRPDGRGNWVWKKHPRQVLYRLPEVLEAAIVLVVEGEKDVETLRDWGFCATTNAGGADAPWLPSFTQTLTGREVILIPDKDAPGRQRVLRIARALLEHAANIIVWEPDDPRAKDITDWFNLGHCELELIAQLEQAREEVEQ
jgi:5S rRNA maturation endonuclease (ribonuclease M5)